MRQKQVSILGCGWLGLPLAKHLIARGWEVKGTTTSSEKINTLETEGITAYKIELHQDKISGDIQGFLQGSPLLIISIPPGLRRQPHLNFVEKIKILTAIISASKVKNLIYISSTGVFQDEVPFPTYTEQHQFSADYFAENQLLQVEHVLQNLGGVNTTILRFGGLVGKERHPVKFLSGRTGLKNPEAPVNLIHLDNCMLLISEIIQQEKYGNVFHGVEPLHETKEIYYQQKAKAFHLSPPQFDHERSSIGKHISMQWTCRELGLELKPKV